MNLVAKFILLSLVYTLPAFAMDQDAEQKVQEAHPAQELIKKEVIAANCLPNVLAPLIAAYAENPYKGNIFIKEERAYALSFFKSGNITQEILKGYQQYYPEFFSNLKEDSVFIYAWVCPQEQCFDPARCQCWHYKGCPVLPKKKWKHGSNFPLYFPSALLQGKKEGETVCITLQGISFALICNQLSHTQPYESQHRFETVCEAAMANPHAASKEELELMGVHE